MSVSTQLLGPDGRPISSEFYNKKAVGPKTGEAFGSWAGRDNDYLALPGGGVVTFDLSKLTLADYKAMRDHYQVNASLAVLSFMQHQSDWHIECEDKKIADFCEEQIRDNWTQLNRAMAQANWAGYSPSVLQWENKGSKFILSKIKDLVPEECQVKWDLVEGWAPPGRTPPKYKVYGGIKQDGAPWPIPVENSFWYSLLMENGDYYGRKLLRPAFTSYYFSILLHLFSNRYYERFGEPTPIARAPFDDQLNVDGQQYTGGEYMLEVLKNLRNRGVVVLPNDKTDFSGNQANPSYDYDIEYLESQMRGADFERYMTRLDEEISMALFTPILLLRTADVGSYNLGQGHMQVYLWMLNAMNDDRAVFINKYILAKMAQYNFSVNAPAPRIVFRKLGAQSSEMIKELLTALTQAGKATFDYDELGQIAGMTVKEVRETVSTSTPDENTESESSDGSVPGDGSANDADGGATRNRPAITVASMSATSATIADIAKKVTCQVQSLIGDNKFGDGTRINMGFKRKLEKCLAADGIENASSVVEAVYSYCDGILRLVSSDISGDFETADAVGEFMTAVINSRIEHEVG